MFAFEKSVPERLGGKGRGVEHSIQTEKEQKKAAVDCNIVTHLEHRLCSFQPL
jgi:hypothetical protein